MLFHRKSCGFSCIFQTNSYKPILLYLHLRAEVGKNCFGRRIPYKYTRKVKEFCDKKHFFPLLSPTNGGATDLAFRNPLQIYLKKSQRILWQNNFSPALSPTNEGATDLDFKNPLWIYKKSQRILLQKSIFPHLFRPQMKGQHIWILRICFEYTRKIKEFCYKKYCPKNQIVFVHTK